MAVASTVTLESRAKRHPSSSLTGFPASSKETRTWTFILKAFCGAGLCSWWSMQSALLDVMLCSKLLSKRTICGPEVTHRLKALGLLASPTALPFPFTIALHCSCAWSWAMVEKGRHVFCKTNPPLQKALYTDGCLRGDTCHEGTLITIWCSWCGQGQNNNNMVTALSVFEWTDWTLQFGWTEWIEECSAPTLAHSSNMQTLAAPDVFSTSLQMPHFCLPFLCKM